MERSPANDVGVPGPEIGQVGKLGELTNRHKAEILTMTGHIQQLEVELLRISAKQRRGLTRTRSGSSDQFYQDCTHRKKYLTPRGQRTTAGQPQVQPGLNRCLKGTVTPKVRRKISLWWRPKGGNCRTDVR